ncbi:MAG TPA: hypothetical protein VGR00_14320, partial [Thermoanaerobaculia bacterium]|nr:hypothetical protein [Thermoanaerobaculia bacterium]
GNQNTKAVSARIRFDAAPGFGAPDLPSGPVTVTLAPGTELRAPDALEFLRAQGLSIPQASSSSPIAGSLSVAADDATEGLYAIARTYTGDSAGTYGLFYEGPSDLEAAEEEAAVYGLRSVAGVSRSNLAVAALPGRDSGPITLQVQVYAASGAVVGSPLSKTLQPGEWYQWNGILALAGLGDGSYGYAKITRVAGSSPWAAYGVVNDAATSDGSYLPAFRLGGASGSRTVVVPVVLDVYGSAGSHFTTELTLVNDGLFATQVALTYKPAPGFGSSGGVPNVLVSMGARAQQTIPDVLQYLRDFGVTIPDGSTGPQAGTLTVEFRYPTSVDSARTLALARTSTPNPDASARGSFGLFYASVPRGAGAKTSALVPALTQDSSVRSNLAVVNLGGGSEKAITLSVQLYAASTGAKVGQALSISLLPGEWYQWSRILELAGAISTTSKAVAVVTRVAGDDTFFAYGVLNDAVTSDGSFLKMIPGDAY